MGLLELLRNNGPRRKPQLWANLPRGLLRQTRLRVRRLVDPEWEGRPQVVRLIAADTVMEVVPRDSIGRAIYLYGVYEIASTAFVTAWLRPGAVFLDVGANCGYYTVLAGRCVGPTGAVHAFEPTESLRKTLVRNVELNGLSNVTVHDAAIWDRSGEVPLYESASPENTGLASVLPGAGRVARSRMVDATTIDDTASRIGRPVALIKMDIEGGEVNALRGATITLRTAPQPALVLEAFDLDAVLGILAPFGYTLWMAEYQPRQGLTLAVARGRSPLPWEPPNYVALPPGVSPAALGPTRRAAFS